MGRAIDPGTEKGARPLRADRCARQVAPRRAATYIDGMLGDLYSDAILKAAAAIPPARRLEAPDATAKKSSRVCGSEVEIDLNMDGDRVAGFGIEARACALGQASASIVARNIVGATAAELFALRTAMRAMLKEGGPPPAGARWRGLAALAPIRDYPQRHASTLLIFEAVAECLCSLGHGEAAYTAYTKLR